MHVFLALSAHIKHSVQAFLLIAYDTQNKREEYRAYWLRPVGALIVKGSEICLYVCLGTWWLGSTRVQAMAYQYNFTGVKHMFRLTTIFYIYGYCGCKSSRLLYKL